MEVKDIFELRKQGKIEEAYNAIRPMYAAHKGHYTTIAMFWIGVDVIASSKTKCNKRVSLSERCRRSRCVARGCLPLSERKKKQPAIQIKKGDRSLPKIN